ncbi:hypothetical protein GLW08_02820 [Pontibacillus yanchengensis]|uniref:Uncharacterized protein n=2 Tax=Pontibacillus yanchengensis TaxID=462910 RepID=A0ACC7VBM2_9BACI|nr:hypothetical protein [Pontibacillus yanchengensis]MYL34748.1 hypothetical protein [Pontibacillus yanchengensis]MYL52266.1 hypothetical protein [Pontibacillus yanchengensis]
MRKLNGLLVIILFLTISMPSNVSAYSYGDPSKEKIAEVHENMMTKLNQSPPNFNEAEALFNTIKEEVSMHMGEDVSQVILNSLEEEDKEATIKNMQKLLALNISRRLEAVEKNFDEYDTSKKLLAKGFDTYEALSPVIAAKNAELDTNLKAEFDKALEALGNPGLFGVGEKESDKEQFIESKSFILDKLKEPLNIEEYSAGHFTESATAGESENQSDKDQYTDFSELKNWLPIVILAVIIIAVFLYVRKRRT